MGPKLKYVVPSEKVPGVGTYESKSTVIDRRTHL